MDSQREGTFRCQLGRFLLDAYASGDRVEGDWLLLDADRFVPDVEVQVERIDDGSDSPVSPERATVPTGRPAGFKERLQGFVLEWYSRGQDIEGQWGIRYPRVELPVWEVRIYMGGDGVESINDDGISHAE